LILLVNPRSTRWRYRIPLSILSIGASLDGFYSYEIVDGNLERNVIESLRRMISEKAIKYVALTVMPGPQLRQSILISKSLKNDFPALKIIWGGYFPTLHPSVTVSAPYVDYVVRDQGDFSFRNLIDALEAGRDLSAIAGLSYKNPGVQHTKKQDLIDPNVVPPLPYSKVNIPKYIGRTFLGTRTINYHSSVGCPFLCGFCAVAAVYKARWIGLEPQRIVKDLLWFQKQYDVNAVEFHDNNFFTSEKRIFEFARGMIGRNIAWWGEGRPDTLLQYDDATWTLMRESGCKMIFFGAESSSQSALDLMNKGGTQTPDTVLALVEKMKRFDIIPELSFVLGSPTETIEQDLERDFEYIRNLKRINPQTEIVLYVYSPVHYKESELFSASRDHGFKFPETLDDWLLPQWQFHDLRKNPVTPWLTPRILKRIKDFERVLNGRYPTNSDLKLSKGQRRMLSSFASWRYNLKVYQAPYELALLQRLFRYRQPEIEGF
jgi:anaerobic magnesium-protoporphyrin IX monomethyl ester cyclase